MKIVVKEGEGKKSFVCFGHFFPSLSCLQSFEIMACIQTAYIEIPVLSHSVCSSGLN